MNEEIKSVGVMAARVWRGWREDLVLQKWSDPLPPTAAEEKGHRAAFLLPGWRWLSSLASGNSYIRFLWVFLEHSNHHLSLTANHELEQDLFSNRLC